MHSKHHAESADACAANPQPASIEPVSNCWVLDSMGPAFDGLSEPLPLARRGMGVPAGPGLYVVTCGDCVAHLGTSSKLVTRVGQLARLGMHRASAEVLCAAFCTQETPVVRWEAATRC
jgi:hypothetical protein